FTSRLVLSSCLSASFLSCDLSPPTFSTLSLHDALPISLRTFPRDSDSPSASRSSPRAIRACRQECNARRHARMARGEDRDADGRSEEHTSELQSRSDLVCRLLLEKKKKKT